MTGHFTTFLLHVFYFLFRILEFYWEAFLSSSNGVEMHICVAEVQALEEKVG